MHNIKFNIPDDVNFILKRLENHGFEAYIVGGCVRDSILNKEIKDYDITTNATPSDICDVFKGYKLLTRDEKYGTISIILHGVPYEITTFRTDGEYEDGRRPSSVKFSKSLLEDVKRRDFTINSLAFNNSLIDLTDGLSDLENGIIRCIGNPYDRFKEDSLRILRALRFSAKYNFVIDEEAKKALLECSFLLNSVSKERVSSEFIDIVRYSKTMGAFINDYYEVFKEIIPELGAIRYFEHNNKYHITTVYGHTVMALNYYRGTSVEVKLALLFHDLGKPESCVLGEDNYCHFYGHQEISTQKALVICNRLKIPNAIKDVVLTLVEHHDSEIPMTHKAMRRKIVKIGLENTRLLLDVKECDIYAHDMRLMGVLVAKLEKAKVLLKDIENEVPVVKVSNLAISGNDLKEIGFKEGKELGTVLNVLFNKFLDEDLPNERTALLEEALKLKLK